MIFGTLPSGETVERHVLSAGRLRASVLSYGAILQTLEVSGVNVVLGLPTLEDYLTRSRYFGAVVGRYGNRKVEIESLSPVFAKSSFKRSLVSAMPAKHPCEQRPDGWTALMSI